MKLSVSLSFVALAIVSLCVPGAEGGLQPRAQLEKLKTKLTSIVNPPKETPPPAPLVPNTPVTALLGSVALAGIEKAVKEVFKSKGVKFPAQLAGCLILFSVLLVGEKVIPSATTAVYDALTPGALLLSKWLPVFFVPALVMLPLSPSVGSSVELAKVFAVIILGLLYTMSTTVLTTSIVMKLEGKDPNEGPTTTTVASVGKAAKPFSEATLKGSMIGSMILAAATILAVQSDFQYSTPLNTAFYACLSIFLYVWGARLPAGFVQYVHPLVTCAVMTLVTIKAMSFAVDIPFLDYLRYYKSGTLDFMKVGAGDLFLYLLGPSVVSFAISMYSRRELLKSNFFVVLAAMLVSSFGGLFGTAAFVRLIKLGGPDGALVRLSVLSRNVTTALAMALTALIEGDLSIAAAVVAVTGIIGATYGKPILDVMNVKSPIVRGLAVGSAAQGLGVASMISETDAFPFAAISMIMTAIAATTIASIPALKDPLVKLATGN